MTVGMTIGRLGGDWVQVRTGSMQLRRLGIVVAGIGSVLATLVPVEAVSLVGFLVAGLGTSVLFPQLYDQAARLPGPPGSGFAAMLIGQRSTGIVAPLVIGTLANTEMFGVGQAMAVLSDPRRDRRPRRITYVHRHTVIDCSNSERPQSVEGFVRRIGTLCEKVALRAGQGRFGLYSRRMRVHLDAEKCQGHNRCYALAPELFDVDDYGQAVLLVDGDVPADLEDKARLAAVELPRVRHHHHRLTETDRAR